MAVEIKIILISVLVGAAYGLLFWMKNRIGQTPDEIEDFDPIKLLATIILAAILGAILGMSGQTVSSLTIQDQLALYGGYIVFVEVALKILWRYFKALV